MRDLYNRDLERAVLGAIIDTRAACLPDLIAAGLSAEHFMAEEHRALWNLLLSRDDAGDPIEPQMITRVVNATRTPQRFGGSAYVEHMAAYASSYPEADARELLGYHILRGISDHGNRCLKSVGVDIADGKVYPFAQRCLEHIEVAVGLLDNTPGKSEETACDGANSFLAELDRTEHGGPDVKPPVSTGIEAVDSLFRARTALPDAPTGFIPELGVVAGRPGEGKTALAEVLSLNIARQGHGVAICSADMTTRQLRGRLIAKLSFNPTHPRQSVPHSLLADESLMAGLSGAKRAAARQAAAAYAELPIHMVRMPRPTIREIRSYARRQANRFKRQGTPMKLFVVDYLDKVKGSTTEGDRRLQIGVICNQLKDLSEELSCTVLLLVQINRSAEHNPGGKPAEHNLKESGDIEQAADWIFLVWRPGRRDKSKPQDEVVVIAPKNRRGIAGAEETLFWHGPTGTMADPPARNPHGAEIHQMPARPTRTPRRSTWTD